MSAPLNYLTSHGARADMILPLTRGVLIISIIVILIVCGLLAAAIFRRRPVGAPGADPRGLLFRPRGGLTFVYVGVGISTLVLVATTISDDEDARRRRVAAARGEAHDRSHRPPMVVGGALLLRKAGRNFHDRERNSHSGRRAGALQADRRRRHPFVLGAGARRQDRYDPGPDQHHLAAGRETRRLSRPVRGILRQAARQHGLLCRRQRAGAVRRMAAKADRAGGAIGRCCARALRFPDALRRLPHRARHAGRGQGRSRSHPRDEPRHHRCRHATEHARTPCRLDRQSAGGEARQSTCRRSTCRAPISTRSARSSRRSADMARHTQLTQTDGDRHRQCGTCRALAQSVGDRARDQRLSRHRRS